MVKYSLVMTPTPCRVEGCIIYILGCGTRALTYLLNYTVARGYKPAISPKRLNIERKFLLKAYIKSYTGFRLPPKCMTLNDLCARFKVIYCLNAAKMTKYNEIQNIRNTSNDSDAMSCLLPLVSPKIIGLNELYG